MINPMIKILLNKNTILIASLSLLSACDQLVRHEPVAPEIDDLLMVLPMPDQQTNPTAKVENIKDNDLGLIKEEPEKLPEFYPGDGIFVGHSHYEDNSNSVTKKTDGNITLNFQDTDIHEVVKVLLGDLLKKNYVIDPAVSGTVNINTSSPLSRDDILPVLDSLLQMSNAAMVEQATGLIKIVPSVNAALSSFPPSVGNSMSSLSGGGFHTQIVPLRYVGAEEIHKIIQPFLTETIAQVDPQRNLIILSGAKSDLRRLVETIHIFDVDWLKGMSLAMVPLKYADADDVVGDLDNLFGESSGSPMAAIVRFIPLKRLNSVIVVTQQRRYLREMSQWIKRLDRSDGIDGQQLYVYPVQNKRASELAVVLNSIFNDENTSFSAAELAPGLEPVTLNSGSDDNLDSDNNTSNNQTRNSSKASTITGEGVVLPNVDSVKIIADESNNSLVILASPSDYQMVESALHKLDVTPLQVLIEASIIEVSLTDELSYGLEWFFKNKTGIGSKNGQGQLDLGDAGLNALAPGFSYGVVDAAGTIRAVLNTLASESKINVLSSPSLMVLDNHTASINIGDQVPILTSQSTSNVTDDARTVNQIEYRDTGVLMTVTPRVNASGLIIMDIVQEVTDVAVTQSSGIDAPTFQRRSIESTISVGSGNTIVLGGLIRDNRTINESGVPGLHKVPVLGKLFGQTSNSLRRTELVVLLTPRAIRNDQDAWKVTNEFKQKLKDLRHTMEEIR